MDRRKTKSSQDSKLKIQPKLFRSHDFCDPWRARRKSSASLAHKLLIVWMTGYFIERKKNIQRMLWPEPNGCWAESAPHSQSDETIYNMSTVHWNNLWNANYCETIVSTDAGMSNIHLTATKIVAFMNKMYQYLRQKKTIKDIAELHLPLM